MLLQGRRILVGVCGGIAAYKACELVRMLIREGAEVQAVLTPAADRFVTALTFAALTGKPCHVEQLPDGSGAFDETFAHLELTRDIDCYAVIPATADTLARFAQGLADNLVAAAYLSCTAPVVIAPAMNTRMWDHPATKGNLEVLQGRGHVLVSPVSGELACRDTGAGHLADLRDIFSAVATAATGSPAPLAATQAAAPVEPDPPAGDLSGRRIVVTAGGTREYLDPVRYLTNASSGLLGLNVAAELSRRGARVSLIETGIEVDIATEARLASRDTVRTAYDLQAALSRRMRDADGLVMLAAVADYSPAGYEDTKHKKDGGAWTVEFTETPDILAGVAAGRQPGQLLVGVSLEDTDWLLRGMKKVAKKGVDVNIAVELGADLPFGDSRMRCALVSADTELAKAGLRSKPEVAGLVADWLAGRFREDQQ